MKTLTAQEILNDFAKTILEIVLFNMARPYVASNGKTYKGLEGSDLYKSMQVSYDKDFKFEIEGNDYLINVDQGRRIGAVPPKQAYILVWLKKKGIRARHSNGRFKSMTLNELAYAISKSISKKGIAKRGFLEESYKQIQTVLAKKIEDDFSVVIANLFDDLTAIINKNADYGAYLADSQFYVTKNIKSGTVKAK